MSKVWLWNKFASKQARAVVSGKKVHRAWASQHGLSGCRVHGMKQDELYLSAVDPNGLRGLQFSSIELHIVGELDDALQECLYANHPWVDIIIHDPPWDRGYCDDRACPGDRRNAKR